MKVTVKSYRKEREAELMDRLYKSIDRVGYIVENQAKENVSKTGVEHPQVQTGQLRSSITHEVNQNSNEVSTTIGTNVYYGKYLEFGTSRMPAYPWLFPAVEMRRHDIKETLKGGEFRVD